LQLRLVITDFHLKNNENQWTKIAFHLFLVLNFIKMITKPIRDT